MKRYFVTGTDTGVGKTFVTTTLARRAHSRGSRVFAFKPIETGCARGANDELVGADQAELCSAAGGWQQGALRGCYQFEVPAAPSVAATVPIDLDVIMGTFNRGCEGIDLALVEGAGGWRVPITQTLDMGALAQRLALPVILVARAGLGTINHSLLTAEAIIHQGCPLAGIILSRFPSDDRDFAQSNAQEIRARCSSPVVLFESEADLDAFL